MPRRFLLLALLLTAPTLLQAQQSPQIATAKASSNAPRSEADERARDEASRRAVVSEAWDAALTQTLDLVALYGERPDYLARLAAIYHRMHRPSDETAAWERFMAVSPHPDRACPMVGRAYRGLGQYEDAIAAFLRCLAAEPGNVQLVYYTGLGYEWAGQLPAARQYYTRAAAMAPPGHDYRVSLARLDLHQGRLDEARNRAAAVLAQVPTHTEGALVAGLAEQRAGHNAAARKYLELAAQLSPEYFDVRLALGILDYAESRVGAARRHFEAAFLSDPARRAEVQPWLDRTMAPR
jgi:tetratricopeptide (TPR) repeat protein